jgi:hypothetical protein
VGSGTPVSTARQLDGALAELAIWTTELTVSEFAALADRVSPLLIKPSALIFYMPLLGRGTEYDVISGKTLTITGTVGQREHRAMYYPSRARAFFPITIAAPMAPGAGFGPLLGMRRNHLIRSA